jgi:hypothetical protein
MTAKQKRKLQLYKLSNILKQGILHLSGIAFSDMFSGTFGRSLLSEDEGGREEGRGRETDVVLKGLREQNSVSNQENLTG